nr:hypothetical protein B0A51_05119 [Rachicladosporium sp. CCFEE 5018]
MAPDSIFQSFRLRELVSGTAATVLRQRRDLGDAAQIPLGMSGFNVTTAVLNATGDAAANLTNATGSIASIATDLLVNGGSKLPPHASHPDFLHLAGLVSEAVLEVVIVALPGYILARRGMFDVRAQKFLAELNTNIFTPALIFSKLASQLNADKLSDLAVIPVIFATQIAMSYACSIAMAYLFGFGKKQMQKNFILAMGVFGNSNSLPISLVLSLSHTISGLHWDKVPGDNDSEVAARGILYLLIFQQLGQMLRWTWGYNVLLKPASEHENEDGRPSTSGSCADLEGGQPKQSADSGFGTSPETSSIASGSSYSKDDERTSLLIGATPANGNNLSATPRARTRTNLSERSQSSAQIFSFPNFSRTSTSHTTSSPESGWRAVLSNAQTKLTSAKTAVTSRISHASNAIYDACPPWLQKFLSYLAYYLRAIYAGVERQMNPPLWAMLVALIIASVPALQRAFFTPGTFVNNSITRAVQQSGNVAVPLILTVLGSNLARSTLPQDQLATTPEEKKEEKKLLYAACLARMFFPVLFMAPVLAVVAKYLPVSILADPIFIIVCFLLTGAPSALQLAQICQLNEVFMGAMSNLLLVSYVVVIFPSTLTLVMLALEVVEWAARSSL